MQSAAEAPAQQNQPRVGDGGGGTNNSSMTTTTASSMNPSPSPLQPTTTPVMTAAAGGGGGLPPSSTVIMPGGGGAAGIGVPTTTRDKYRVVTRAKTPIQDDEIRIASDGRLPRYVTYAARLLADQGRKSVTIKATGNAISVAITLAEIVKRRFMNLHQLNTIGVTTISDTFEPLEEGLDEVVRERDVPFLEIVLTSDPAAVNTQLPGYQKPIDQSLVKVMAVEDIVATRSRGGGRGNSYRGGGGRRNMHDGGNAGMRRPQRRMGEHAQNPSTAEECGAAYTTTAHAIPTNPSSSGGRGGYSSSSYRGGGGGYPYRGRGGRGRGGRRTSQHNAPASPP